MLAALVNWAGITFALYDADADGSLMWGPESHAAVLVSAGLFSVGRQTSGGISTRVSAFPGE